VTVGMLIEELQNIINVHPEAEEAAVIARNTESLVYVSYIGYDKKRKRITLEQ
jgi:hypothetical protein